MAAQVAAKKDKAAPKPKAPYAFRRVQGRQFQLSTDTWFIPASGPGGQGYYYFASGIPPTSRSVERRRDPGDLHTLEYSGHHCVATGGVVSTLTFSYHACTPPCPSGPWRPLHTPCALMAGLRG